MAFGLLFDPSLEPSCQDGSNEGSEDMFSLRKRKILLNYLQYPLIWSSVKFSSCCCTWGGGGIFIYLRVPKWQRTKFTSAKGPLTVVKKITFRNIQFTSEQNHVISKANLLPLIQERQLSVTNGESMCTKYWLTA